MKVLAVGEPSPHNIDTQRAETCAPSVMAAIRAYDPCLTVWWDKAALRWSLMRISRSGYHCVFILQNPDGTHRPLDMSLLKDIHDADLWRGTSGRRTPGQQAADRWEQQDDARHAKSEADFRDDIAHATRENRRTLRRVAALAGQIGKAF
jgi:hypothetical protein